LSKCSSDETQQQGLGQQLWTKQNGTPHHQRTSIETDAIAFRNLRTMAEYLASIFGTEKDKVNCPFYFKIGACRHGASCSRLHNKPTFSQTLLMANFYHNPQNAVQSPENLVPINTVSDVEMQTHYDDFFEDIFIEMEDKYGEIEEMNVCDNLGDHLVGNVYVKYRYEEDAAKAVKDLNERWYAGQPIYAELSPVTDFREACCRQYEMGECTRGGFCNFMHLKPISPQLKRELYNRVRKRSKRSRSRSISPPRPRSRSRDRVSGGGNGSGGGSGGGDAGRGRGKSVERLQEKTSVPTRSRSPGRSSKSPWKMSRDNENGGGPGRGGGKFLS